VIQLTSSLRDILPVIKPSAYCRSPHVVQNSQTINEAQQPERYWLSGQQLERACDTAGRGPNANR
jgi:hypothetical protein